MLILFVNSVVYLVNTFMGNLWGPQLAAYIISSMNAIVVAYESKMYQETVVFSTMFDDLRNQINLSRIAINYRLQCWALCFLLLLSKRTGNEGTQSLENYA